MNDRSTEKSPGASASELKTLVKGYAIQEVKDPLAALAKWVGFGLAGAVFVCLGLGYLTFGVLRLFQSEIGAFDGGLTFINYWVAAAVLFVGMIFAGWGMKRTFDDD